MSPRLGWVVVACLAASSAMSGTLLLRRGPGFSTLPILVPVSLEHERAQRTARGQPASPANDPVRLAEALLASEATPGVSLQDVAALRDARLALLDARERRHALNIRLMDVGIAVARELTPAQWERIHMHRDALRRDADAALFDRLLGTLRGGHGEATP